jgi:hypothetical protein
MRRPLILAIIFLFIPLFSHASVVNRQTTGRLNNSDMLLYWDLDGQDTSWGAGKETDKSGNGRDGTIGLMATSTTPVPGVIGQAFSFGASSAAAGVNSATFSPAATGFSLSFWMKSTQASGQVIMGWGGTRFGRVGGVTANKFNFTVDGTSAGSATTACTVNDGVWHHIVFTTTASAQTIYCDNVAGTPTTETLDTTSSGFVLGKALVGDTLKYTGLFDDVRIYSRVLAASDVQTLYNLGNKAVNANSSRAPSISSGLVGYWTLDGKNMTNGVAQDTSGNSNNGNLFNLATSTAYILGKKGQAINFQSALSPRISVPAASSINDLNTNGMTVSLWAKPASLGTGTFISKGDNSSGGHGWAFMEDTSNGRFKFTVMGFTGTDLIVPSANNSIALNTWAHLTVTWDGTSATSGVHLYLNGTEVSQVSPTAGGAGPQSDAAIPIQLGAATGGGANGFYNGVLDDVRVYSRPLSATEVSQLYKQSASQVLQNTSLNNHDNLKSGLLGYWTFDGKDMPNGRVSDLSGRGNNGSLLNIATTTFYATGKIGQAGNFDGADDRVTLGTPASLNNIGTMTVSAWIKPVSFGKSNLGTIVAKTNFGSTGWKLSLSGVNHSGFGFSVGFTTGAVSLTSSDLNVIPPTQWIHVVATWDGGLNASGAHLYKNGVETSYLSTQNATAGPQRDDSVFAATIGAATTGNNEFAGGIDDVRIYNRALSASEVLQLYNLGR